MSAWKAVPVTLPELLNGIGDVLRTDSLKNAPLFDVTVHVIDADTDTQYEITTIDADSASDERGSWAAIFLTING